VSGDRLLQLLLLLTVLLFVSVGVLPLGRSRYPLAKWARWGAIVIFSVAVIYALILTLRWGLNRNY
jgi:protein-S-isoprenylcysteine O-methyltransferase Ste14